ncbi:phage tail protein [Clostridium intestinale]|uniref:Phage minor structural protein, N-terminal region n=1 Tax=Clostridium intestinale DSM 6191 TaxID=1121320 RepID=A0A1M5TZ94_9CLOT|nr:phage tail protein [Clostridium intestinale]SHH56014.1 phage minor structural protein, N-terminal region [Clostridium intestinale DSM 6191]
MLILYDLNKTKIAGLKNYKDLRIERDLSGDEVLFFSYPQIDSKHDFIKEETYVRTKKNEYVIKEVNIKDDWTEFVGKVNVEDLKGKVLDKFEVLEQQCADTVNLALIGTGWSIGSCDLSKKRTVRKSNCSIYDVLLEIKKIYLCDFKFDAINKKIYIYQSMGSDKGSYFSDKLNLKKLEIQSNSYDFCTRIIPIGKDGLKINNINSGKEYVENYQYSNKVITVFWEDNRYTVVENLKDDAAAKLNELSKPIRAYSAEIFDLVNLNDKYKNILNYDLGDTITLLSKDKKVNEKQRIVKIIEYPDEPERNSCEIANRTLSFEDIQANTLEAVDTVNSVTTSDGMIDNSKVDFNPLRLEVINLVAQKVSVGELEAAKARIGTLETTSITTTEFNAYKGEIDILIAKTATIENLEAVKLKAEQAAIDIGSINTLLAGNITAANIKAGTITAGSGIIANEAIGDAQIANLKVSKLLAGDLSTSKFKIVSDSGNMLISDNTIQIKDSSRVRVQIGKDASNDYNMYVWDNTGNLMFDATGLKASGIKSKIIRDDMVSDTANISGNKIEKESLVSQINGATTTLKASKIKFDDINQTLDIAFNSLKTTIYETGQTVSSQGTAIGTLQGQISTKIWQTDITTAINNVVIGGRNLAQKTSDIYIDAIGFTGATNDVKFPHTVLIRDLNVGDNVTVSFTFKYSNLTYNNASRGIRIQGQGNITGWGNGAFNSYAIPVDFNAGSGEVNVSYRMIITSEHLLNSMWYINFRTDYITGGTISLKSLMIEKGNKKTTWTRALEDLDTKISENYSAINQTISGVNTTVGSMQTSISGHETRIGTAEGSINTMKEQIVLKVEKTDIYNIAGLVTKIDDRDASLIYTGTWSKGNDPAHYNTTYSHNSIANTSVKLTFDGVGVRWITSKNTFRGYADVKIDGAIVATNVDTYSATTVSNFVAFEKLGLTYGQHTIEIIVKGTKRAEAASPAVLIDYFEVLKEAQTQIDSAVSSISILSNQISSKVSAADFGSLIEQNPSSVRVAVGQIGGTNLLKGTDFSGLVGSKTPQGWWYWGSASTYGNQGSTGYNNAGTICIQNSTSESGGLWQSNIPLKPNTKYTLSLAVTKESNVKGGQFTFEYMDISGANISNTGITLIYDGKRHSYTFTTPSNFASAKGGMQHQGSYNSGGGYLIFLTYPKLEEGENSTSWSPNANELKSGCFEVNDSYARFTNQDGSYTEFTPGTTGLKWHKNTGDSAGKDYHYLMATGVATISENLDATITLGDEFKGKSFEVLVSVKSAKAASGASIELFSVAAGGKNIVAGTFRILGYMSSNYNPTLNKYTSYINGTFLLNDNTNLTSYPSFRGSMEVAWIAIA